MGNSLLNNVSDAKLFLRPAHVLFFILNMPASLITVLLSSHLIPQSPQLLMYTSSAQDIFIASLPQELSAPLLELSPATAKSASEPRLSPPVD